MSESINNIGEKTNSLLVSLTRNGMNKAAEGLSTMTGKNLMVDNIEVLIVSVFDLPNLLGEMEEETIAIYLRAEGEMAGQIMITMTPKMGLELVDLLLFQEPGTTKELDRLSRSALAEVGNLCGTFFLNSFAEETGLSSRPSPPAVIVDMLASVMNIVMTTSAEHTDTVVLLKSDIVQDDGTKRAELWIVPDVFAVGNLKNKVDGTDE